MMQYPWRTMKHLADPVARKLTRYGVSSPVCDIVDGLPNRLERVSGPTNSNSSFQGFAGRGD